MARRGRGTAAPRSADVARLAGVAQKTRQPFDAVAQEGLKLLMQAIEKPEADPPAAADPPVELIVRASTAAPPARRTPER